MTDCKNRDNLLKYKVITEVAENTYTEHTSQSIYDALGKDLDLSKAILIIDTDDENESERIRSAITDIRMWEKINNS